MKKKIGVLGGTFDPVHTSHLELAEAAQYEFNLNKVLFVPAAVPPHKIDTSITSFNHRVRMVELACEAYETFLCSPIEGEMATPSYTIDTIKVLLGHMGRDHMLYFIIGSDAFLDILTWKSYREIPRLVSLIVSRRRGIDETKLSDLATILEYDIVSESLWSGKKRTKDIWFLEQTPACLSSTMVKKYIKDDQMVKKIIPKTVAEYIRENNLYTL